MFTLRIHTINTSQALYATPLGDGAATKPAVAGGTSNPKSKKKLSNPIEIKGVVHLFRNLPFTSSSSTTTPSIMTLWNIATRTTVVFIAAVPNYLSHEEFIAFCGTHVDEFTYLCFIRNDAVEDRYSVLIKLVNQVSADGFCICYNGKRFSASETELCHIYLAQLVEYTDSAEVASITQPGYTELPTCPVCLERLDYDTSSIQITLCDHSFQCPCISKRTYLSCQVCRLCQQQDGKPTCAVCGTSSNLWVCLICGLVGCGRYEQGHAIEHFRHAQHCYSLKLETQQIWDYVRDKYVHRSNQSKVGSKSVVTNHQSSVSGALFSSKVDTIVDEYNFLFATQMETQRKHYEALLVEAKSRKETSIAEAIEKVEIETIQEIQHKLGELARETKDVSNSNEDLAKEQDSLKKEYKEIQESCLNPRNVWEDHVGEKITNANTSGVGIKTYANLLNAESSKKKVNFRTLEAPTSDGADVAIPLSSVFEVNERLGNTIYGYFLGKRIAFPEVENYAKNAWTKYGLQKTMNSKGFFFFKFASAKGMDEVLENGPWMIRTVPIIIRKWSPNASLLKEDLTKIPVWVKLHDVPISAFTEDGLSVIATKLGTPMMLDSYTSSMCVESWGRSSYARAMIEVRADCALKETIVVAVPRLEDAGFNLNTIRVEYEWKPLRCEACKVFGHCDDQCPKKNMVAPGQVVTVN